MAQAPDAALADRLVKHGEELLKMFHEEYAHHPTSAATEFRRGKLIEWRHFLALLYGEHNTETIVLRARENTQLSVPPAGPLSTDGKGYEGFDSQCDGGYIGPLK